LTNATIASAAPYDPPIPSAAGHCLARPIHRRTPNQNADLALQHALHVSWRAGGSAFCGLLSIRRRWQLPQRSLSARMLNVLIAIRTTSRQRAFPATQARFYAPLAGDRWPPSKSQWEEARRHRGFFGFEAMGTDIGESEPLRAVAGERSPANVAGGRQLGRSFPSIFTRQCVCR
jgi:hypothetical protein